MKKCFVLIVKVAIFASGFSACITKKNRTAGNGANAHCQMMFRASDCKRKLSYLQDLKHRRNLTLYGWREYKKEKCPICGHVGWCGVSADGNVVHCMRVPSAKPVATGGYIHFLGEATAGAWSLPKRPSVLPRRAFNATSVMAGFRAEFETPDDTQDIFDNLNRIGAELNLPPYSLDRLGVGKSLHYQAWAFPMRDADANCIGIRLRRFSSADKFSVAGSRDGLFFDPDLEGLRTNAHGVISRELVICEGATDCAAGYSIGLPCVGRSACNTGAALINGLIKRLNVRRVTIVADNDRYKTVGGALARPGLDGAKTLQQSLIVCSRIVVPPCKDLREWVTQGLTFSDFFLIAGLQKFSFPFPPTPPISLSYSWKEKNLRSI